MSNKKDKCVAVMTYLCLGVRYVDGCKDCGHYEPAENSTGCCYNEGDFCTCHDANVKVYLQFLSEGLLELIENIEIKGDNNVAT